MKTLLADEILKEMPRQPLFGSSVLRILCSTSYVDPDTRISELADVLTIRRDIPAVAVVSETSIKGVVTRKKLFDQLGRAYGREILGKKSVQEIMDDATRFAINDTIFMVAEKLDNQIGRDEVSYYLVEDMNKAFSGIFSSKDLLIYLADITKQDISMARMLQQRLVKEEFSLRESGIEIEVFSRSAGILGGDFYFVSNKQKDRWFVTLCDVSGKGVSASIITSLLWGTVTMLDGLVKLKKYIKKLNQQIVSTFHLEKYLTGIFMNIHPDSGKINFCDMGHSLIYLLRDGKMMNLKSKAANIPVGISPDLDPITCKMKLESGDILVLMTDGLIEQVNVQGEEFSYKRIKQILSKSAKHDLKDIRNYMVDQFYKFKKGVPQHDDTTFVLIRKQ